MGRGAGSLMAPRVGAQIEGEHRPEVWDRVSTAMQG